MAKNLADTPPIQDILQLSDSITTEYYETKPKTVMKAQETKTSVRRQLLKENTPQQRDTTPKRAKQ